jgi:hypothetical protein
MPGNKESTMSTAESFACGPFARFMNSAAGRILRVVVGVVMIIWGYTRLPETSGVVLLALGFIPLIAGWLDLCIVSALLGGPIAGSRVRKIASKQ